MVTGFWAGTRDGGARWVIDLGVLPLCWRVLGRTLMSVAARGWLGISPVCASCIRLAWLGWLCGRVVWTDAGIPGWLVSGLAGGRVDVGGSGRMA